MANSGSWQNIIPLVGAGMGKRSEFEAKLKMSGLVNGFVGKYRRGPVPPIVFHYTSAAGLHGIITTRCMRATDFSFLNDPSELEYGSDVVRDVLADHAASGGELGDFAHDIARAVTARAMSEVYVACFTTLEDDLGQWRAYGGSAKAKYCIGFSPPSIQRWTHPSSLAIFAAVIYDVQDQRAAVESILNRAFQFVRGGARAWTRGYCVSAAMTELQRLVALLKSPAYAAEQEWRVVRFASDQFPASLEFDPTSGFIRPFVRLEFGSDEPIPIQSLHVLAPSRPVAAVKAAGLLMQASGIGNIVPVQSAIPFAD